jgi:ATP adenylyltransferase
METIWAPWRVGYILGEGEKPTKSSGCIFCDKPHAGDDKTQLIVARAPRSFVILNVYPYNNGHLMVVPYRHVAQLEELSDEEAGELMMVARRTAALLKNQLNCEGINLGMNVGAVAGAGIDAHLHLHLVPRWAGDTNFMPVIADTKVIPQALSAMIDQLSAPLQTAIDELQKD